MPEDRIYLGLGSNLGQRENFLKSALEKMKASDKIGVLRVSPVYETEPVGFTDQDSFLNIVVEISSKLPPEELMADLEEIESRVGKKAEFKNGPREIDIDILLYGKQVHESEKLKIPHPGLSRREFALRPLLDLEPYIADPTTNMPYRAYLKRIKGEKQVSIKREIDLGFRNEDEIS
ncbi:MAG TPA: 2-amino-4-hydroxy-6-hydroxymethyldihydropteridine diphosphokinase [candidate division Zixibacteria bacterium]|nr:2-amino-4-hydroxy-6-hydroxymethyldihydropteridine diphosphokinase [candidate division Zixibacteria bacterium]HEQ99208.1 2-amino-4-hydroxy-6-hydroxymethyldihydropteridine diphosphokinase [candidate division Zixibacteria bacterium]